jgi:hypothetical protein
MCRLGSAHSWLIVGRLVEMYGMCYGLHPYNLHLNLLPCHRLPSSTVRCSSSVSAFGRLQVTMRRGRASTSGLLLPKRQVVTVVSEMSNSSQYDWCNGADEHEQHQYDPKIRKKIALILVPLQFFWLLQTPLW